METLTMYTTAWCPDCRRAKSFLKERGVEFREVNIEEDPSAEEIVIKANEGKRVSPYAGNRGTLFFLQSLRRRAVGRRTKDPAQSLGTVRIFSQRAPQSGWGVRGAKPGLIHCRATHPDIRQLQLFIQ